MFFLLIDYFKMFYFSKCFLPILFILCGVLLSVWLFTCGEVWTLGVWVGLACHKRLFNPPPKFSRLDTWCPAFVCMCVCVFGGLSSLLYLGGGFVCGGLAGK